MFPQENSDGTCEVQLIHGTRVALTRRQLPDPQTVEEAVERFRMLGDPTRLKILFALSLSELCVCELASTVGVAQSVVSQHLKILRAYRFVQFRKQGRMAFYRLASPQIRDLLRHVLVTSADLEVVESR